MQDARRFRDARDAAELSLGGAFANIRAARQQLDRLADLVPDRSEVDGLRGIATMIAYSIEGLVVAVGRITPDGSRS